MLKMENQMKKDNRKRNGNWDYVETYGLQEFQGEWKMDPYAHACAYNNAMHFPAILKPL